MNGIDKKILITAVMAIALAAVLVFDYSDESAADPSGNILDSGSNVIGTYTLNGYTLTLSATSVSDETVISLSNITVEEKNVVQRIVVTGFTNNIAGSFDSYPNIIDLEYMGSVSTGGSWTFSFKDGAVTLVASEEDKTADAIEIDNFNMKSLVKSVLVSGYEKNLSGSFTSYSELNNNITYKGTFSGTPGGTWEYQMSSKTLIVDRLKDDVSVNPGTYRTDTAPFRNMFFKDSAEKVEYRGFTYDCANLFHGLTAVKIFWGLSYIQYYNNSMLNDFKDTLEELRYAAISKVETNTVSIVKSTLKVFTADNADSVSARTFENATKLATVNLYKAGSISDSSFKGCTSLQILNANSLKTLERSAFEGCTSLRTLTLPAVTSIGTNCFLNDTSLTSVVFGSQVALGNAAFSGCSSLVSITCSNITSIGNDTFSGCSSLSGEAGVFNLTALKSIDSSSDHYPFRGCTSLTRVIMPAVTNLGPYSFNGCTNLVSVTIGNYLEELPDYCFINCEKLNEVTLGTNLYSVGSYAFYGCSVLEGLELPEGLQIVSDYAFANSGILSFETNNVRSIGANAFNDSKITSLVFGDYIETIGKEAFMGSSLSGTITFPQSITAIENNAFAQTQVRNVVFSNGGSTTVEIGQGAFSNCSNLNSANLGDRVSKIDTEAFSNCSAMEVLTFGEGVGYIGDNAFSGCNTLSSQIEIPKTTTYLGKEAFKGTAIRSVSFADDSVLDKISDGAFQNCRSLRVVIQIPDSVIEIGENAFSNSSVQGITFNVMESKLTTIQSNAFLNCTYFTNRLDLPVNLTTINESAFNGCNLRGLGLGPKVSSIGSRAFQGNANLTEVVLPNTTNGLALPAYLFSGCSLTDIYISSSVTSIASNTFSCPSVKSEVNIWFNGPLSGITLADGAFSFGSGSSAKVYADPSSKDIAENLSSKITGVTGITYEQRVSGNISFVTTVGPLLYSQITAIYGSKIVLPYYTQPSGEYGSLYYAVKDNSPTESLLSVFANDTDFNEHSESNNRVARSGYVIPVYPLSDLDSISFYGLTDISEFTNEMTITTDGNGMDVDIASQNVHYGGLIRVPSFIQSELIKKSSVMLVSADGLKSYNLTTDTESVYAGMKYSEIRLTYVEVYIDVTFVDWEDVSHVVSVKLRSKFVIPPELASLETAPEGYEFNGWWTAKGGSGVKANENTTFYFNQKWYVDFQPLSYTIQVKTKATIPGEPTREVEQTVYGPYTLHVVGNSLYYTDAKTTVSTMIFDGGSITGWTVDHYQDNRGRSITGDTGPLVGDRTGENAIFIRLSMNLYDLTLEFYNGSTPIEESQIFKIRGWEIGDGEDYHFGTVIKDVKYTLLENGLDMPVPINQTYAFNNLVAGSTVVPRSEDGHYYLREAYFEDSDTITIRYNMDIGVYTVEFAMNDDASSVAFDGPLKVGDSLWLNAADFYTKVGYNFHHYSIPGDTTEYKDARAVTITEAMAASSTFCVITVSAVWTPIEYSITFDLGDYSAEIPAQTVNNGGTVTLPDVSAYYGHYAESWFWTKGAVKSDTFTANPTLTSEIITTYADGLNIVIGVNWALKTYTLNVLGDTSYKEIENVKLGDTVKLWEHGYVPQYKAFSGWGIGEARYSEGDVTFDAVMAAAGDSNSGVVSFTMVVIDIQYHVRYDADGGVGSIVDLKLYVIGDEFALAEPDSSEFYKTGYSFIGWRYSKDSDTIYGGTGVFKEELARNADQTTSTVTFYATWAQKTYRITYELEGGRYGPSAPSNVGYGDPVTIDNPTRVGYTFEGWTATGLGNDALYRSKSGTNMPWNGTLVNSTEFRNLTDRSSPVILTAHWAVASYSTQYLPNGGTWSSISSSQYQIMIGEVIELPTLRDAKKTGYSFAGWGIDTANVIAAGTKLTEAMVGDSSTFTLYAIWTPVVYQLQYRYLADSQYSTINVDYGMSAYVPILERAGYTFRGWTISGAGMEAEYSTDKTEWYKIGSSMVNGTYFRNMSTEAGAVITMNAEWTPIEYRVAYNCNGGTGIAPTDTNVYTVGTELVMKDYNYLNGTNGSKTIIGWSLELNGSAVNVSEFTQGLCNAADATNTVNFYGVWISDMCTVLVDLAGGSPNYVPAGWTHNADGKYEKMVNPNTSTKDALEDWSGVTISKGGYSFSGWEYDSSIVLSTVTAYPVFDKIQTTALYGFLAIIAAFPIIAVVIFVLNRPR